MSLGTKKIFFNYLEIIFFVFSSKLEDYSSEQGSRRKIILTINEKQFIGYGTNKRECKMSAAKRALAYLENISNSDDDINDDSVASDDVST